MGAAKPKGGSLQQLDLGNEGELPRSIMEQGEMEKTKVTTKVGKVVNCWLCSPRKKADRSVFSKIRFIWLIPVAHLLAAAFWASQAQGGSSGLFLLYLSPAPMCCNALSYSHHNPREVRIRPCFISQSPLFSRFKKILKIHIPDPKKFFPPLVSVHGGDIQVWDWGWIQVVIREK